MGPLAEAATECNSCGGLARFKLTGNASFQDAGDSAVRAFLFLSLSVVGEPLFPAIVMSSSSEKSAWLDG